MKKGLRHLFVISTGSHFQWWSRGHKARGQGQGHKKNSRPRTAFSRTDPLEAKNRNARGQGHRCKVFSKTQKELQNIFLGDLQKKDLQENVTGESPKKKIFKIFFQVICKILTTMLFSSR